MEIEKQYCITESIGVFASNYLVYLKDAEYMHIKDLIVGDTLFLIERSDYSQRDIDIINSSFEYKHKVKYPLSFYNIPFDIMSIDTYGKFITIFSFAFALLIPMSHKVLNEILNEKMIR